MRCRAAIRIEQLEARRLLSAAVAGVADATFGPGGLKAIELPGPGIYQSLTVVAQQPGSHKLIARGNVDHNLVIARLNLDGTVDRSFGVGGFVPLSGDFDQMAVDPPSGKF